MTDSGNTDGSDEVLDKLEEIQEKLDEDPDLNDTTPQEAKDLWLQDNQDKAESTLDSYDYRTKPFLEFLSEHDIDVLSAVTTRDIKQFQIERTEDGDLDRQSQNNQFGTISRFLAFCYDINAVPEAVVKALDVPGLSKDDRVNTEKLVTERAKQILENLNEYEYASRDHTMFVLMWRTGARIGCLHALDIEDCYLTQADMDRVREELRQEYPEFVVEEILEDVEVPFLWPKNRPETDTRLKLGDDGERVINLADWVGEVIQDYIRVNRPNVTDDHGRDALFASRHGTGRLSRTTLRNRTYILTEPCEFGGECPHNRDPEECEAREHGHGSKCPSSRSPHKLRTGSITWHRDNGWPVAELADRANTSEELIEGVYDQPEKLVRGAHRRSLLGKLEADNTEEPT